MYLARDMLLHTIKASKQDFLDTLFRKKVASLTQIAASRTSVLRVALLCRTTSLQ